MGDCTRRNACKRYDFAILELLHRPRRSDAGEVNIVKVVTHCEKQSGPHSPPSEARSANADRCC